MKKKYQVFISSTSQDLREERREIINALLKAHYIPIAMEFFPAANDDAWNYIKKIIDECDYFLLILGGTYGSEIRQKSFTQREYEYALFKKKDIVSLIHEDINKLPEDKKENEQCRQDKLKKFQIIAEKKLCNYWGNSRDLCLSAVLALNELKSTSKQPGWIRATKKNFKDIASKRNLNLIKNKEKLLDKIKLLEKNSLKNDIDLKNEITIRIKSTDMKVNSMFPSKIHSPATKGSKAFSAQKLINSLGAMGIPMNAVFDVFDLAIPDLIGLNREVSQLTTTHIRKVISHALYKLNSNDYSEIDIQVWGDSYVRKYGNPDKRINVITEDGNTEPITYYYLKHKLIPDIFHDILGEMKYKSCLHASGSVEISKMSEEVLHHLKELNLYYIHYNTLLNLSKDLALQPPHPWISIGSFDYKSIQYDYERAKDHLSRINKMINEKNIESIKYSLKECLHHSSSGILSMYGVFMGCGYLSPFHHLRHYIKVIDSKKIPTVYSYSDFERIVIDLNRIDITIMDFNRLFKNLNIQVDKILAHKLNIVTDKKMIENINQLFNIFDKIYKFHFYK